MASPEWPSKEDQSQCGDGQYYYCFFLLFLFFYFFSLALSVSPCRISVFLDAASWIRRKYSIDLSLGDGQFVWLVTGHWRAMCQTLATNGPVTPEATQILLISKLALQTFLILVCCN